MAEKDINNHIFEEEDPVPDLNIKTEIRFSKKNLPKGEMVPVFVDGKKEYVLIPLDVKDGTILTVSGGGKHNPRSGKTGDLYVLVCIEDKAVPWKKLPIPAILIAGAIVIACLMILLIKLTQPSKQTQPTQQMQPTTEAESVEQITASCSHVWIPADCTQPKTCSVCGETEGEVSGHKWRAATCTSPQTCDTCGETFGALLEHQWIDATYSTPKTCSICAATEGEKLKVEPIYINNMTFCEKSGKLWTRSENPVDYPAHPNTKDISVWEQEDIPGHTVGKVYDNRGNQYQYGLHLDGSETRTYYISYDLGGIYTLFTGWCAFPETPLSNYARYSEKYIEIYLDGKLEHITGTMDIDSEPEFIEIDVTDVKILTIQYPASNNPNEAATLYDGMLS